MTNINIGSIPQYLVYDDACRLRRFIENRLSDETRETSRLDNITPNKIIYVVDKLHIQGHTETWCHENCHPRLFPELERINTVVCEQINFWLGGYKHIMKHMNEIRYNFYLYIIFNEYNNIKINGKFKLFNHTNMPLTQRKRMHTELTDDEED